MADIASTVEQLRVRYTAISCLGGLYLAALHGHDIFWHVAIPQGAGRRAALIGISRHSGARRSLDQDFWCAIVRTRVLSIRSVAEHGYSLAGGVSGRGVAAAADVCVNAGRRRASLYRCCLQVPRNGRIMLGRRVLTTGIRRRGWLGAGVGASGWRWWCGGGLGGADGCRTPSLRVRRGLGGRRA